MEPINRLPIGAYTAIFKRLTTPVPGEVCGAYRAEFAGPLWLRKTAPLSLAAAGFQGWWGKQFDGSENGVNLFVRQKRRMALYIFSLKIAPSLIDSQTSLVVRYGAGTPFPWPHVQDELRWLDARHQTLLGFTIINVRLLRRFSFPFLLQLQGDEHDARL